MYYIIGLWGREGGEGYVPQAFMKNIATDVSPGNASTEDSEEDSGTYSTPCRDEHVLKFWFVIVWCLVLW